MFPFRRGNLSACVFECPCCRVSAPLRLQACAARMRCADLNKGAQCKVFEFLFIYPRGGLKSAGLQDEFLLAAATLLMKRSG